MQVPAVGGPPAAAAYLLHSLAVDGEQVSRCGCTVAAVWLQYGCSMAAVWLQCSQKLIVPTAASAVPTAASAGILSPLRCT